MIHSTDNEIISDEAAVVAANGQFYRALENCDYSAMAAVWLHTEQVKCIHPGWELLVGWKSVGESWQRIFAGTRGMRVRESDVQVQVDGDFGLISCLEHLAIFTNAHSAPSSAVTTATNLFQRVHQQWRMIHHHASPVPELRLVDEGEVS